MSEKLVSFMIEEKLYTDVQSHCFSTGQTIKRFIADSLHSELVLQNGYVIKPKSKEKSHANPKTSNDRV